MKVKVDLKICDRQAVCIGIVPKVFAFDEKGELKLLTAEPPNELHALVEDAEAACPVGAISVEK